MKYKTKSFILLSLLLGLVSCSDETEKGHDVVPDDTALEAVESELPSYELRVLEDAGSETAPMTFTGALSESDYAIVDAINEFSFKLFRKVRSNGSTGDNPFVSPFSVQQVLAMLCNATEGSVQSEILSALGYEEHSIEADRMRYQLLKAEAMNKSFVDMASLHDMSDVLIIP